MKHVEEELSAFHFGALDNAKRQTVELHLSTCTECLLAYFEFKHDTEASDHAAPARVHPLLRKRVDEVLSETRMRRPWHKPAAFAFAAAAVLLASLSVQAVATGPGAPPRSGVRQ
jgi:anti-sigma factor RsiW